VFPGLKDIAQLRSFLENDLAFFGFVPKLRVGENPLDFQQAFLFAFYVKDSLPVSGIFETDLSRRLLFHRYQR